MASLKIVPVLLLLASPALAQSYGIGHTPTAAERAQDITLSPAGANLPVGRGTAAQGKKLFVDKGCEGCHGVAGAGGVTAAPKLLAKDGPDVKPWDRARTGGNIVVKAPYAVIPFDFIRRAMPLGSEGTLTVNEVYSLTAYLFAVNKIMPENQVLDQNSLPKIKMPVGDDWKRAPDWKPKSPRLAGYPY